MTDTILEMRDITKTFPGVKALENVSFDVRKGEIHAIVGENGAGKSTLMKVLSGVYPYGTYEGTIVSGGTPEGLDTSTYDNGNKVVPSILLTPYSVDLTNYQKLVIDSGYLKPEDIQ